MEHCGTTGFAFTRHDVLQADCKLRVLYKRPIEFYNETRTPQSEVLSANEN